MHVTKVHATDGSDAEHWVSADQPLKPDLYRCLHPTSGANATASEPARSAVCGKLLGTLQNLTDHLRGKAHRVTKVDMAKYITAVPWNDAESHQAAAHVPATSNAPLSGQRQPLHGASAAAGASANISNSGNEYHDEDIGGAGVNEQAMEEAAEESEPAATGHNSAASNSPLGQGYWRCMLPVSSGPCRRGFNTLTKLRHHFSSGHQRDPDRRTDSSDFEGVSPPSIPDRYACSKEGCKFVQKDDTKVRLHLKTEHGVKDAKTRTEFIRVIEANAVASGHQTARASSGAASSSFARRVAASATASKQRSDEDDEEDAEDGEDVDWAPLRRQPKPIPKAASSASAVRGQRAAAAAAKSSHSSAAGGTQPAQVQPGAAASGSGSASHA
jgi:hypothetical protein